MQDQDHELASPYTASDPCLNRIKEKKKVARVVVETQQIRGQFTFYFNSWQHRFYRIAVKRGFVGYKIDLSQLPPMIPALKRCGVSWVKKSKARQQEARM